MQAGVWAERPNRSQGVPYTSRGWPDEAPAIDAGQVALIWEPIICLPVYVAFTGFLHLHPARFAAVGFFCRRGGNEFSNACAGAPPMPIICEILASGQS